IAVVLVAVAAGAYLTSDLYKNRKRVVIATVNDLKIYKDEGNDHINSLNPKHDNSVSYDTLDERGKEILVREVAAHKLLAKEAKNTSIDNDEVDKKVEKYRENLIKEMALANIAKRAVTEESLKAHYDKLKEEL